VVGFVDDAFEKQGVRIQGVLVLGHSKLLPTIIKESQATQVILAMPSAPGSRIRELAKLLHTAGVRVKTLPSMESFLGRNAWKPELRDIAIEDLLRREPIQLDLGSIHQALMDSVVLITGAGGSIGSELARQVATFNPSRLILLGRGENSLWGIERELHRLFPELVLEVELCDIRNPHRLQQAFEKWRPEFVFHAAAHKHVPYLEQHPEEGIENNIFGTLNVLKAAKSVRARKVVNVSTDKAVNPTSVLGVTKRIAEFLVLQAAEDETGEGQYVSVRFGNVLGSRGSVIPLFHDQIRHGGPLTVTDPDMTRYFMTIPEASQLVLQAGIMGETGKVFVLDMGEPVRIVDLAADMARLSGLTPGYDIDIQITGIRPGEKLYEELFTDQEQSVSNVHPKVFEAVQEPKNRAVLDRVLQSLEDAVNLPDGIRQQEILHAFKRLVPTYHPSPIGLGKHLAEAIPSLESRPSTQGAAPKIIVLRPSIPLPFAHVQS
jgi:FlaA1/EpsC-like NDP-sugar epimerase